MFNNYKIDGNTLILYVDFNYEFGLDFNLKNKYNSMKKEIKKIIKKLNFDGTKIALSIGGIVLATILLVENPKTIDNFDLVYVNNKVLPITEVVSTDKKDTLINNSVLKNSEIESKEKLVEEIKKEEIKKEKIESNNVENKVIDTKENEEVKNDSYEPLKVTVYRNNDNIIELNINDYLIGVVGGEMPASFNIEALKVQAIISRTYALKSIKNNRKLTDTVSTQVYLDNDQLKNRWGNDFLKYYNKIKQAVYDTDNICIYYNNELIDSVFFSTTNGKTEDSKYVWGNSIPYLKSVDSSWDKDTTPYLKEEVKDLNNVLSILGVTDTNFNILSRNESGRVLEVSVGDKIFSGVEFRNLLGLRSSDFDILVNDNNIIFTTRGYGHGVGLSQYGANKMAASGYSYTDIIKHYYTGVEVK